MFQVTLTFPSAVRAYTEEPEKLGDLRKFGNEIVPASSVAYVDGSTWLVSGPISYTFQATDIKKGEDGVYLMVLADGTKARFFEGEDWKLLSGSNKF